jgi:hypothetical protein
MWRGTSARTTSARPDSARARGVEQVFPLHDLQRFFGARRQALLVDRRTGRQPALQGLVLLIGQPVTASGMPSFGWAPA